MAIAQRELIQGIPRNTAAPIARPASRPAAKRASVARRAAAQPRASIQPMVHRAMLAALLAGLLSVYIYGYMQMTGANYQRVQLQSMLNAQLAKTQMLHSRQMDLRDKEAIALWAGEHGMAQRSVSPIVIGIPAASPAAESQSQLLSSSAHGTADGTTNAVMISQR